MHRNHFDHHSNLQPRNPRAAAKAEEGERFSSFETPPPSEQDNEDFSDFETSREKSGKRNSG